MANADLERIIKIVFEGDDKQAIDAINRVTGGISALGAIGDGIHAVADPLGAVADSILKVDAALAALVVGGIAVAINESGKFGDAFNEISTLITASGGDIDKFRGDLLAYASDSKFAIEEINSAVYSAISAGVAYTDSINFVSKAESLAIAGKASLKETTVALASVMNAYGAEASEAERYSDALFTTVRLGQTTLPELSDSLSRVTSMAASAGIPIETITAAIAALTAKGMPTTEAITSIRGAMQAIIKPTEGAAGEAEKLGLNFSAAAIQSRGFEGVLLDVYKATGGNIGEMTKLFTNVEGLNGALGLFGQDGGKKFLGYLEEMQKSSGATAAAYDKMKDNFSLTNQEMLNNMRIVFIEIGDKLQGTYGDAVGSFGDMFRAIGAEVNKGTFDPFFELLTDMGSRVQTFFGDLAATIPQALEQVNFSGLLKALKDLAGSVGGIFDDFDPKDPEDVGDAIQFLVDSLETLVTVTEGMVDTFKPVLDAFINWTKGINATDEETKKTAGTILANAKLIADGGLLFFGALKFLGENSKAITDTMIIATGAIQVAWNTLPVLFGSIALAVAEVNLQFAKFKNWTTLGLSDGAKAELVAAEQAVRDYKASLSEDWDDLNRGANKLEAGIRGMNNEIQMMPSHPTVQAEFLLTGQDKLASAHQAINDLPDKKNIEITTSDLDSMRSTLAAFGIDIDKIPEEKLVSLKAITDDVAYNAAVDQLMLDFPSEKSISLRATVDQPSMDEAQGEFNRFADLGITVTVDDSGLVTITNALTGNKDMNITAKVDKAKAESDVKKMADAAKELEKSVEWRAKLDIAEVEANAKILEAAFTTLGSTFDASTSHASSLMKEWSDAQGNGDDIWSGDVYKSNQLSDMMESEEQNRQSMLSQQRDLTAAEIDYMRARTTALAQGDALIKVDGSGLAPHLEAIMWDVLAAIQVRANEDGQSMLLGLS